MGGSGRPPSPPHARNRPGPAGAVLEHPRRLGGSGRPPSPPHARNRPGPAGAVLEHPRRLEGSGRPPSPPHARNRPGPAGAVLEHPRRLEGSGRPPSPPHARNRPGPAGAVLEHPRRLVGLRAPPNLPNARTRPGSLIHRAFAAVAALLLPHGALSRALLACFGIAGALHLGTTLLNTLLPLHMTAMGATKTQVGLLFSAPTLVGMFLRPLVGGWVDQLGARLVIIPGAALLLGTSLALHLAGTPTAVIVLAVGAGISASVVTMPASIYAADASPAAYRGEAMGTYYLFSALPVTVAPPLALLLFRFGGVSLGFAIVSALAIAIAACALALPSRGPALGRGPSTGRLASRYALGPSGVLVLQSFGYSAIYAFVPLYAIARGKGAVVPWFFGVYSVALIVFRVALRGLSDRVGRVRVLTPAMAVMTAGYACLALPPSAPSLLLAALCLGSGGALLYPTLVALVVDRAPAAERGLAIGTVSGAWDVGVVIGSTVVGFVIEHTGYGPGLAAGAVASGLGVLWFAIAERRRAPAGDPRTA